jgi:hypothetical protein
MAQLSLSTAGHDRADQAYSNIAPFVAQLLLLTAAVCNYAPDEGWGIVVTQVPGTDFWERKGIFSVEDPKRNPQARGNRWKKFRTEHECKLI